MLGILDYGAGNLRSVCNALDRLGEQYFVSDDPDRLKTADKLLFPGVGHADAAMTALRSKGLDIFLREWKKPLLGICLGMQLLFDFSEEGETECLGIIPGTIRRFDENQVKIVPHMGWNTVNYKLKMNNEKLNAADFYFVHSYYCSPINEEFVVGETDYNGQKFCSIVQKDRIIGCQFHPEKSATAGARLLEDFCADSFFSHS